MTASSHPKRFAIHAHHRIARYELEDLRAYASLASSLMAKQAKRHDEYVDDAVSKMPPEEREAYFENNSDTYDLLVRRFPNQQQQSLIVLAYSVLEDQLVRIAESLLKSKKIGLTLKNLAGKSPFQKSRTVITAIAGLKVKQALWEDVDAYRLVRNAVVHNLGYFAETPPPLVEKLLQQKPTEIKYSDAGGLIVEPTFVLGFLSASGALLESIFEQWLAVEQGNAAS